MVDICLVLHGNRPVLIGQGEAGQADKPSACWQLVVAHMATQTEDKSGMLMLDPLSDTADNRRAVQAVFDAAPDYCRRATGYAADPHAGDTFFDLRPDNAPGSRLEAMAVVHDGEIIGCISLLHDWPRPATTHIGLLLIAQTWQGRGLGRQAITQLWADLAARQKIERVRLAVLESNRLVGHFWRAQGWRETGDRQAYSHGLFTSRAIIFERLVGPIEPG